MLAGDKLSLDIRKLEAAYYDQHVREMEITKHISLLQVDPDALLHLKTTGKCELSLPEWLYNMDYPGHYNRRLKSVSISIPCIAGPYTSINCTLSLLGSSIRINNLGGTYERAPTDDSRFVDQLGAIQSIATSHGQRDNGMFQLNFADERFLPFEGTGAISNWKIDLPIEDNQFDFSTISDVIIHIQYTSKDGGNTLAVGARSALTSILPNAGVRLLSMKSEFPTAWHRFFYPTISGADQELVMQLKVEHFPFYARNKTIKVKSITLIFDGAPGIPYKAKVSSLNLGSTLDFDPITENAALGSFHKAVKKITPDVQAIGNWILKIKRSIVPEPDFKSLPDNEFPDVFVLVEFNIT